MGDDAEALFKLKLTAFDGEQTKWSMWKRLTRAKLLAHGLDSVITGEETPDAQKNSKVYFILLEACYAGKASPITKIVPEGDGRLLWKKLVEKYEGTDLMRMITMLKTLVNLEPTPGADPAIFFSKIEELRDSIETWYQGLIGSTTTSGIEGAILVIGLALPE